MSGNGRRRYKKKDAKKGNGDKDTSNKGKKAAQNTKSGGCCSCKCFLFIFLATSASVVAVIYQNPDIQQHIGSFLREHVEQETLDKISEKCQIYSDIAKQKYQDIVQQISEIINGNERTKRDAGEGSEETERKNQEKLEAERKAKEEQARLEAEKKAKEEKARLEAERKAKEEAARIETEKKAKEEKARLEAEKKAKEEKARLEAEKKAKEEQARLEAEKKAKEEKVRLEAEKKAKEEKARLEAEKKAKEEQARLEAEKKAKEEQARLEAEKKAKEEKARLEAEKKAKEDKARLEAEKKAKEEKARLEAEKKAKEEQARLEAEKKAKEEQARLEAEKKAKEEKMKLETEKKAKEEKVRLEAEKKAKEDKARLEAEKKKKEDEARLEAEKKAKEEKARLEAEKKAKEEQARLEAEKKAKEEQARLEAEKKAKEEKARLEAEKKAKEEQARLEADKKAKEEKVRLEAEKKAKEEKVRLEAEKKAKEEKEAAKYSKSSITSDADYKIKETLDASDDLYNKKKFDEALASYEKILGKHPKSPRAQYGKGLCLDSLAEEQRSNDLLEDAIGVLQGVIELKSIPDELLIQAGKKLADRQEFRGWGKKAAHTMRFVAERFPNNLALKNQLGVKYLLIGEDENAKQTFKEVLDVDKTNGFAKVHLGFIYKTTDNELEKAIPLLKQGIDSKEPGTEDGRFYFHLGDAYQRVGQKPLAEQVYEEGAKKGLFLSKYQRSLYNVKSLTSRPWWTPEQTKQQLLFKTLEANWEMIRDEGLKQLNPKTGSFMPEEEKLIDKGDWKQFTLYARGKKNQENCAKVPKVCDLIDKFPDAKGCTRGQVKYSVMEPGIHVWPHCGPTNCRLRSHLGLVIPPGPKIRVADEIREWKEGKFIIFDDSFEHEVWHDGNATRLVLIVDFWHPELNTQQKKTLSPI